MAINKLYIGIDNGVSGTIGCICNNYTAFFPVPVKKEQDYTKKKSNITRIRFAELVLKLKGLIDEFNPESTMVLIERPMVNPTRFHATKSALRALESTLIAIEYLGLPFGYCDSKEWQKELLPKGGKDLKKDSRDIGSRLFPIYKELFTNHGDADGMLIAEYCRRKY